MTTSPIARQTAAIILDEWCPGETTSAWLAEQIQCAIDDSAPVPATAGDAAKAAAKDIKVAYASEDEIAVRIQQAIAASEQGLAHELDRLRKENDRLRGYAQHKIDCNLVNWNRITETCDCGLKELLEKP